MPEEANWWGYKAFKIEIGIKPLKKILKPVTDTHEVIILKIFNF